MATQREKKAAIRIEEILRNRRAAVAGKVSGTPDVKQLQMFEREQIAEELTKELCEKGLDEDDEPNSYGLELEGLIDALGMSE